MCVASASPSLTRCTPTPSASQPASQPACHPSNPILPLTPPLPHRQRRTGGTSAPPRTASHRTAPHHTTAATTTEANEPMVKAAPAPAPAPAPAGDQKEKSRAKERKSLIKTILFGFPSATPLTFAFASSRRCRFGASSSSRSRRRQTDLQIARWAVFGWLVLGWFGLASLAWEGNLFWGLCFHSALPLLRDKACMALSCITPERMPCILSCTLRSARAREQDERDVLMAVD